MAGAGVKTFNRIQISGIGIDSDSSSPDTEHCIRLTRTFKAPSFAGWFDPPCYPAGLPRLVVSLWGYFVISLVLGSFDSVLPLFVKETFGWQQSGQGLIFIPLLVPHITDPLTGWMLDNFPKSCRYITSTAFICVVPVLVLLRMVTENSMQQKVLLCALLSLAGLCLAVAMPPLIAETFHAVKEKEDETPGIFGRGGAMALAFGLVNMGFAAGTLIGPFFAGFIRQSAGWGTMGWALALVAGISSVPILLFLGGWILRPVEPSETATDNAVP